jgi:hypothetical protein
VGSGITHDSQILAAGTRGMTDKVTSWWGSLHDGYLERFTTSAHDRTATLAVRIGHLADDPETGRGSHFEICLKVVRAVNITAWESWGPFPAGDQPGWNEALLHGRMVSIEADDFATSGLRITDATVYETLAKDLIWPQVTFTEPDTRLQLLTLDADGSESQELGDRGVAVIFSGVQIYREGEAITTEEFLALGESFWRKFRERAEQQKV